MTSHIALSRRLLLVLAWVASLTLGLGCTSALADPPERVARLSYASGAVSFSPSGEDEWVDAVLNRPFITGDRLWTDNESRAELQIGSATLHIGAATSLAILNLDDRIAQFQLTQGSLNLHVRQLAGDEIVEIDTPNLAFSVREPGEYRIDVDENGDATAVSVHSGYAEVFGQGASYGIDAGQWYRFYGEDLGQREYASNPPRDELDRWAYERDRRQDASRSLRYVSPQVIGYADLDEYGTWQSVQGYGNVWVPTQVAADWAPYRQGHWAWIEPWGWNWVDDAPWGFAPFHYGRWAWFGSRWGWVPGPPTVRPVYAPALVAFAGGDGFRLNVSAGRVTPGIAWFPLAPGEVYRPPYRVSRNYFTSVNVSNTRVDRGSVANLYDSYNNRERGRDRTPPNINYANRQAPGAITAVPQSVFSGSQSISRAAVPVSRETLTRLQPLALAPLAPAPGAVLGPSSAARGRPPGGTLTRPVIAREKPPAPVPSFAVRQPGLAAQPGRAPETALPAVKPAERSAQGWPQVRVVGNGAPPVRLPPLQGGRQATPQAQNPVAPAPNQGPIPSRPGGLSPLPPTNPTAVPPAVGGPQPGPGQPPQTLQRGAAPAQPSQAPRTIPQPSSRPPQPPVGQPGIGQPGSGIGQPGSGIGQPGSGIGQPGSGIGQPNLRPAPPPVAQPAPSAPVAQPSSPRLEGAPAMQRGREFTPRGEGSPRGAFPAPGNDATPRSVPQRVPQALPPAVPPPAAPTPPVQLPPSRPPELVRPQPAAPSAIVRPPEPQRVVPPPVAAPAPLPAAPPPGAAPQELRRGEPRPPGRAPGGPRAPDDDKR